MFSYVNTTMFQAVLRSLTTLLDRCRILTAANIFLITWRKSAATSRNTYNRSLNPSNVHHCIAAQDRNVSEWNPKALRFPTVSTQSEHTTKNCRKQIIMSDCAGCGDSPWMQYLPTTKTETMQSTAEIKNQLEVKSVKN